MWLSAVVLVVAKSSAWWGMSRCPLWGPRGAAGGGAVSAPLQVQDVAFEGGGGAGGVAGFDDAVVGVEDEAGEGAGAQDVAGLGAGPGGTGGGPGGECPGNTVEVVEADHYRDVGVSFVAGAEAAGVEQGT